MEFANDSTPSEHEVLMTFESSINTIRKLNESELTADRSLHKQMAYMLYANVITALETYLCDRFISLVKKDEKTLRKFVESFNDYNDERFSLSELFIKYEEIESKAIESMKGVLYHNLPKVSGMYRDTFGIKFPVFSEVFKSVLIRHDLVHRGGKTKDGAFHDLNSDSVEVVIGLCSKLVEALEAEFHVAAKM